MAYYKGNSEKKDIYQKITDFMVDAMEKGKLPWQKSWDGKVGATLVSTPINGATKRPYTKENILYLGAAMQSKDSDDPRFFTYKQAENKGYHVKRGAKGFAVKQGFFATKDLQGNPLPEDECHWTSRISVVFHASDIAQRVPVLDKDGKQLTEPILDKRTGQPLLDKEGNLKTRLVFEDKPIPEYVKPKAQGYTHEESMELAEQMLQLSGAVIKHDQADRAYYNLTQDNIHLPPKEAFPELDGYYSTALHELGHWTGHPSRLNRDMGGGFGSRRYAKEELRAEMASAFLSADLGIPLQLWNHAAYTKDWLKALKNDKMEFFKAANDAQKIAGYLKGIVKERMKELDAEHKKEETPKAEKPETEKKPEEAKVVVQPEEPAKTKEEPKEPESIQKPEADKPEPTKEEAPKESKEEPTKKEEQAEEALAINYKYYMNHRPPDIGALPKDFVQFDENDRGGKYGAVYYARELTKAEVEQYQLEPDPYYRAMQQVQVTLYQTPNKEECPWQGIAFNDYRKPIDFAKYKPTYTETVAAKDGVTKILNNLYTKMNGPNHPKAQDARSMGMSDIVRMDNRFFYTDSVGFKEISLRPVKNMQIAVPVERQQVAAVKKAQIAQIGQETFNEYRKRFHKVFLEGANAKPEECLGNPEKRYSKFIYDSSIERCLSGIRPCDQKAWQDADRAFLQKEFADAMGNEAALINASRVVNESSPYQVVSGEQNYGLKLGADFKKTAEYRKIREDNREVAEALAR